MALTPVEVDLWRPARPVSVGTLVSGYCVLMGFAVKETSGSAAAEIDIYNGADTKGLLVLPITLAAGESTSEWYGPQGIEYSVGILSVVATGAVAGTVWIADRLGSNR